MSNKEIRDILLGRIVGKNEQVWMAAPADSKFHFHGLRDGAGDVRFFGVMHLTRSYQVTELEPAMAFAATEKALNSMGHPVQLASVPEAKGCLYAPNWIAPVLLTAAPEGENLCLTAYTGRSLLAGWFRCRIALWILEQRLPEGIIYAGRNKAPNGEKAKKEKTKEQKVPKKVRNKKTTPKKKKDAPK